MKVQMIAANTVALACAMGRCIDNVKPEAEVVGDQRTGLQVTWPRNGVGEYVTIAELMSETTESDGRRRAIALAIQAYIWIRCSVNRRVAAPHLLPVRIQTEITSSNVKDDVS